MTGWMRWLFSPCVFGHADRVLEFEPLRGDDRALRLVWVCPRCRDARKLTV